MTKYFCKKMHFFKKKVYFWAKMGSWAAICDRNFGGIVPKFIFGQGGVRRYNSVAKCEGEARISSLMTKYFEKKNAKNVLFSSFLCDICQKSRTFAPLLACLCNEQKKK